MSPESLWANYIQERQGLLSLWRPYGFVAYRIADQECFIADMFIERSERRSGKGRQFIDEMTEIAANRECNVITANIHLADPNANKTLAAAMACGFQVTASGDGVLLIAKKIKER
jgi:predicted GNAT superfamily acetyltransferase